MALPNRNEVSNTKGYHLIEESPFPDLVPKEARTEAIRALFERKDRIVRKDIEKAPNVSQASAILLIRELVNRGVLIREGGGKYTRYRLGGKELFAYEAIGSILSQWTAHDLSGFTRPVCDAND